MAVEVAGEERPGVGCYGGVSVEMGVVEQIGEGYGALFYCLQREYGMVD